jgi:hypothetical protein
MHFSWYYNWFLSIPLSLHAFFVILLVQLVPIPYRYLCMHFSWYYNWFLSIPLFLHAFFVILTTRLPRPLRRAKAARNLRGSYLLSILHSFIFVALMGSVEATRRLTRLDCWGHTSTLQKRDKDWMALYKEQSTHSTHSLASSLTINCYMITNTVFCHTKHPVIKGVTICNIFYCLTTTLKQEDNSF